MSIESMPTFPENSGKHAPENQEVGKPLWERLTEAVSEQLKNNPDEKFKRFAEEKMNDPRFEEERRRVWNVAAPHNDNPEEGEKMLAKGLIISLKTSYEPEQRKN